MQVAQIRYVPVTIAHVPWMTPVYRQSVSAVQSFFLAMTLYPEVQRKAQEEIDRVVGSDRLPAFADRKNLPYINALLAEVLRWIPIGPLGMTHTILDIISQTTGSSTSLALPHRSIQDDWYNGYYIPKGSNLIPNIWFVHIAALYPCVVFDEHTAP